MDKQTTVFPCKRRVCSNRKEQTIDAHNESTVLSERSQLARPHTVWISLQWKRQSCRDKEQDQWLPGAGGGGRRLTVKEQEETTALMEMVYVLIVVVVTWLRAWEFTEL